ncbi:MAG: DUF2325 domain-containing protein [Burkholderiales bacterium]|nr:DUF2325 domain-containing protein [Burkholderiales bacterium]
MDESDISARWTNRMGARCCAPGSAATQAPSSRRRRLWELGTHAHCPVIGVCLSLDTMRRLARKLLVLQGDEDDYTLHCQLVTAAERRNPASEALQRELDSRFALDVQQATKAKCMDSLAAWWRVRAAQGEIAGPLWATLTHPRCEAWLEMRVLGQVHMLQHQVGAAQRVDVQRHREVLAEHQALMAEYAGAQQRMTQWATERQREQAEWEAERVQARGRELALQSQLQQLQEQLQQWQAQVPQLAERLASQQRVSELLLRNRELQRLLDRRAESPTPAPIPSVQEAQPPSPPRPAVPASLRGVVLCVGGRSGQVPVYRRAVEDTGAQFLHHDGGEEERVERLDPQLAAADLVICQTGCISHDAYWRVKEH